MLIYSEGQINDRKIIRVTSDKNHYVKIKGEEEMSNEIIYDVGKEVEIIETKIPIEEQ